MEWTGLTLSGFIHSWLMSILHWIPLFLLKLEQQDQSSGYHVESCTSFVWPTVFMLNMFKIIHALFENQNMTTAFTLKYHISYIYYVYSSNCTRRAEGLWKGSNLHPALLFFMYFQTSFIHLLYMTSVIHPKWM